MPFIINPSFYHIVKVRTVFPISQIKKKSVKEVMSCTGQEIGTGSPFKGEFSFAFCRPPGMKVCSSETLAK